VLQELDTRPDERPQRPETALLLQCGRAAADDGTHTRALLAGPVDWAYLLWVAHRQGLLPPLYWHLRTGDADGAATAVIEQLAEHFAGNARRNRRLLDDLGQIVRAFDAEGLAVLPLRVPFLLARVYEHPGLRQSEPLDLLAAPSHGVRAQQILASCGYEPIFALTPGQNAALRRTRGVILQHRAHGGRISLHERPTPIYFPLRLDAAELWERRELWPLGEGLVPLPALEDQVLLLCAHGALNLWSRLAWVTDLARTLATCGPLRWEQIMTRARAARAERMLHVGLSLVRELLGVALPQEVQQRATADPLVAPLVAEARRRLLVDLHGWTSELERARFRMRAREHLLDRVLYGLRFALTPTVEDWQAVPLHDGLLPLYRIVRPLRLARALSGSAAPKRRAPFMTTPMPVVERMLALADVRPSDVVYDLGCGDGRIVIAAAQRYGARGVGVDLDPARIAESRANARAAGVDHLVAFVQADALGVDLRPATVVTLWMLQTLNFRLRPKLRAELRPGARIVGHSFDLGDWIPARTEILAHGGDSTIVYVWTIDQPAASSPAP
jgi:SAM-dependent methyltransferase